MENGYDRQHFVRPGAQAREADSPDHCGKHCRAGAVRISDPRRRPDRVGCCGHRGDVGGVRGDGGAPHRHLRRGALRDQRQLLRWLQGFRGKQDAVCRAYTQASAGGSRRRRAGAPDQHPHERHRRHRARDDARASPGGKRNRHRLHRLRGARLRRLAPRRRLAARPAALHCHSGGRAQPSRTQGRAAFGGSRGGGVELARLLLRHRAREGVGRSRARHEPRALRMRGLPRCLHRPGARDRSAEPSIRHRAQSGASGHTRRCGRSCGNRDRPAGARLVPHGGNAYVRSSVRRNHELGGARDVRPRRSARSRGFGAKTASRKRGY